MNREEFVGTTASMGIFVGFEERKGISREINTGFPGILHKDEGCSLHLRILSAVNTLCNYCHPTNISAIDPVRCG